MFVNPSTILIKTPAFRVVFAIGVALILASFIVTIVYSTKWGSCVDSNYCYNHYITYTTQCMSGSQLYCCNPYSSSSSYYCGGYSDCFWIGGGYAVCGGFVVAQWVLAGLSLVCLITLIVIARVHRNKQRANLVAEAMANNNVIYTD